MSRLKSLLLSIAMSLLIISANAEEHPRYLFDHIPSSITWINSFYQDEDGFMWLGTRNGLYRYPALQSDSLEEALFAGDNIDHMQEDEWGRLWMRRRNHFSIYDPKTNTTIDWDQTASILGSAERISNLYIDEKEQIWWIENNSLYFKKSLKAESVLVSKIDNNGSEWRFFSRENRLYLLSLDGKVYCFDISDNKSIKHLKTIESPTPESDYQYYIIYVDSRNDIWLSHGAKGVWHYDNKLSRYSKLNHKNIPTGLICRIIEDDSGDIWIASDHGGILIWHHKEERFSVIKHNPTDNNSIASNSVYALYKDRDNNIWIGYAKQGISIWRGESKAYSLLHLKSYYTQNLKDDINAICEDLQGRLWFGTDSGGLLCFDPTTGEERIYTSSNCALRSNVITALHCDNEGRVWIGTFLGGLSCYDNGKFTTFTHKENDPTSLASDNIWSLEHDSFGRIYIGTLGGGLQIYDPKSKRLTTYNQVSNNLSNDHILQLDRGNDEKIYMATAYGLSIFDPLTNRLETVITSKNNESLTQQTLLGLCCDIYGSVWLNCEGELKVYDTATGYLLKVATPGLKAVQSLTKGSDNSIWAIADNGICHIHRVGTTPDGVAQFSNRTFKFPEQNLRFNQRSSLLTKSGAMLVGGFDGYMRLSPRLQELNDKKQPQLYFTGLHINNTPIRVGEKFSRRVLLPQRLEYCSEITLHHDEKLISLDFAALNFSSSFIPELQYRMQGLSDRWIPIDRASQQLTFYNLKPGEYTLTISTPKNGSNNAVERSIKIVVLLPWWSTTLAIIGYIILFIVIGSSLWLTLRERQRRKIENMERELRREKERYTQELKMQFFTNVSHDFRTPLTLILSPIEELINKDPSKKNDIFINTIYRNAQRLLTLVNQLLDLRKLEMSGMSLNLSEGDITTLVEEVCDSFRLHAENSSIEFTISAPKEHYRGGFDRDKVIKIMTNLLSNAFKFTPKNGKIEVSIEPLNPKLMRIKVADNGCGISQKDKRYIFDRFYQSADGTNRTGNGIGLHIAREFVTLHGGEISVEQNNPEGTIFSFTLPLIEVEPEEMEQHNDTIHKTVATLHHQKVKLPVLMLVDDNDDFRNFMYESLKTEYDIISVGNGAEALKRLDSDSVDIVICDVMMPVMDGMEFCRRAKSNINHSHIPIILLTARTMQKDEYMGLESGADDYITKPFNINILRLRIAKLLEWKERAHALFNRQIDIPTEQITITSLDDKLLQMAIDAVNENISNTEFSVSELSSALNMHRTHLYKKLLFITGKAPLEFIRAIRLKHAAQLLESGQSYISEVAYMVGFNSPKIFARHFKEEFGCSPSEYQRTHTTKHTQKENEI